MRVPFSAPDGIAEAARRSARRRRSRRAARRRSRRTPPASQREPGERHEGRRRSLQHLAADDRADGDDRRGGGGERLARCPGTARIGAIEASGLDGPITIARARGDRREHLGSLGARRLGAAELEPSIGPRARSRIMNSWNGHQPPRRVRTHVRTGSSLIGSTRARTPDRRVQPRERGGRGVALGEQRARARRTRRGRGRRG